MKRTIAVLLFLCAIEIAEEWIEIVVMGIELNATPFAASFLGMATTLAVWFDVAEWMDKSKRDAKRRARESDSRHNLRGPRFR